jgi:hypothetical protein
MSKVSLSPDAGNLSPNRETLKRVVYTDVSIAMWNMCTDHVPHVNNETLLHLGGG